MYILTVPFFATIYDLMPKAFYAPYARIERNGLSDAYAIGEIFESAIKRAVGQSNQNNNSLVIRRDLIKVQRLKAVDNDQITFEVIVLASDNSSTGLIQLSTSVTTNAYSSILVHLSANKSVNLQCFSTREGLIPNEASKYDKIVIDRIFPGVNEDFKQCLPLSSTESFEVRRFFEGISGDPVSISGGFYRMMYFSSVVITTLGFGDIVPMTDLARAFVAMEALSGIVIFGLFLNAVAYRASMGIKS